MRANKSLPPLIALRAFEAAGRHLSFRKAADELHVTPSAITHQVGLLEEYLGVKLFKRRHRKVELTGAAPTHLPKLHEAFESMRQTIDQHRKYDGTDPVVVYAAPSFSTRWLMARLHRFKMAYPDIEIRVFPRGRPFCGLTPSGPSEMEAVQSWAEEADVVVVYGRGGYPGLRVEKLLPLSITPLCSPKLLLEKPLLKLADLRHHTLLHDNRGTSYEGRSFWDMWLDYAEVTGINTSRGPRFYYSHLAMEAAIEGMGVVATTPSLVRHELDTGLLVAPFDLEMPLKSSYHMVSSAVAAERPGVDIFRHWLLAETAGTVAAHGSGGATRPELPLAKKPAKEASLASVHRAQPRKRAG